MSLFVNYYERGSAPLLEDGPQGSASIRVVVDEESRATLEALVRLGSCSLGRALAAVFAAGIAAGQRAVRGSTSAARRPEAR
jgi:hypothetical protein